MRRKSVVVAIVWFFLLLVVFVLAPFLWAEKAQNMNFLHALEAPSTTFWLGTDSLGRDILSRLLCGAGVSLSVGFVAVGLALVLGVFIGAVAGYYGGLCDRLLMGFTDTMLCFPTFFLILSVIAVLGPNIWNVVIIIGLTSWMGSARLVRAEILSLKEREFILAARALGATDFYIIFKHLIPNAMGPVIVNAILGISSAILLESALSFLGLGVQPPLPSWGNILMDGKATLGAAWWLTFFPGLMIFLTVLSANLIGNELHEHIKGDSAS